MIGCHLQGTIDQQCANVGTFFDTHPLLYKIALVAIHIFRSVSMFALMQISPFSFPITFTASLALSLLYFAAVEKRSCPFYFTLPAFVGGVALSVLKQNAPSLLSRVPFALYTVFVCYLSNRNIEERMATLKKSQSCCHA